MKNIRLFFVNGEIKEFFDAEVDRRVRQEYTVRQERELTRNMLTDPDAAVAYSVRVFEIKCEVKREIEEALGFSVDVGFDPEAAHRALTDRVGDLENTTGELNEALTMILEGVVE